MLLRLFLQFSEIRLFVEYWRYMLTLLDGESISRWFATNKEDIEAWWCCFVEIIVLCCLVDCDGGCGPD